MFDRTSLYLRFDIDRTSLWHRLESKDVTKLKREQCKKLTNEHWGLAVVHRTPVRERSLSPVHSDDTDRQRFLQLLEQLPQNYTPLGERLPDTCTLYAYCLMSNHVHLLYRQGTEEVDQSMKRLEVSYAQYFNKKYGRTGHFFQDRFKSEPCEDFSYFLTLLRYIHQNPIKAGITHYAEEYPWSSWHEYIGNDQPYICNTYVPLKRLQQSGLTLQDLIEMVNDPLPDDCGCLEMDETDIPQRLSDEQARDILEQICGCRDSAQFQHLPIDSQRTIVAQAATQGAAINQLARITGLSYRQVYKIVKKK